jgi:uncharacterized protein (TIGR02611 family)
MNTESDGVRGPSGATVSEETRGGFGGEGIGLGSRAPEYVKARPALHVTWRVGVFVVGLAVVAGGVLLLPLPGPGWLVIFAGLGVWGTEFVWAQRVLRWGKRKVTKAAHRALDPRVRRRNIALTTVGVVLVAALIGVYVWRYGWRAPWAVGR